MTTAAMQSTANARRISDRKSQHEPWRRALLVSLLLLAFLLGCFPMSDFDVWWHLRTGQLILERGVVPQVDFLTYTNAGRVWIDLYWLFQIGIAGLYRLGGSSALVLMKPVVAVAVIALSLGARRAGNKAWPAALVWLPALIMLSGRLCERPELFSLLFLAGFLWVLARAPDRPRLLWILPLIQVFWVNFHGFFVLGPLVLMAYSAEWIFDQLRPKQQLQARPPVRKFATAAGASLLACVISPYGLRAVTLPLEQFDKLGSSGIYRASIGELMTVGDFIAQAGVNNPYLLAFFVVFLLGVLSFLLNARRGRISLYRILLFFAAAYLGWQAKRNNALFALVAAFVTTWNLDDALHARPVTARSKVTGSKPAATSAQAPDRSRRSGSKSKGMRKSTIAKSRRAGGKPKSMRQAVSASPPSINPEPHTTRNWNIWLIVAAVWMGIAIVSGSLYAWAGEDRSLGFGERPQWYAHGACNFLARQDFPERIVAFNISQAAVCIAHVSPTHKLFMDPRLEVNSQETFEHYLEGIRALWRGQPGWEVPLGIEYGRAAEVPALLIERGPLGRAAQVLSRDTRWRCVYADAVATVFVASSFAQEHNLSEVSLSP